MESFKVQLLSKKEMDAKVASLLQKPLYEHKADIHGTCTKLFTDNSEFMAIWQDNFTQMLEGIRPHVRVFAVTGGSASFSVLYEPNSKTAIIQNCTQYGLLKSIILGIVADFFEDTISEHPRYPLRGSLIDYNGHGLGMFSTPGSGKTSLTYGLLTDKRFNLLADDWFFIRMMGSDTLAFAVERNPYLNGKLASLWPQFAPTMRKMRKDSKGHLIANVKALLGSGRIRWQSTLSVAVIITRDKNEDVMRDLSASDALDFMVKNDFCNPYHLRHTREKFLQRKLFYKHLFQTIPVYLLNTIEKPDESLEHLKGLLF